ncbi:MAG: hypothetical protein QM757_08225 [Paludibaculum sp.]
MAPGSTKLVTAHSMPALPVPEIAVGELVGRAEQVLQALANVLIHLEEEGIQVALGCRMASTRG